MANKSTADKVATIQKGYVLEGATIELGAAIVDGELHKDAPVRLPLSMMNRHGLVAGATGTGKTVTLQVLAEAAGRIGVPTFLADVKGDLAGLSQAGGNNPKVVDRLKKFGLDKRPFTACPVTFWDVYGEQGHPVRTTVADMGPVVLARLLNLSNWPGSGTAPVARRFSAFRRTR